MTWRKWLCVAALVALMAGAGLMFLRRHSVPVPVPAASEGPAAMQTGGDGVPTWDPDNPCGPAVVAIVGQVLGKPVSLAETRRLVPADSLGRSSAAALVEGLAAIGIPAAAVRLDPKAAAQVDVPLIVFLDKSHFGVLICTPRGELLLADPPVGVRRPTIDELASQWTGEAIITARDEQELAEVLRRAGLAP